MKLLKIKNKALKNKTCKIIFRKRKTHFKWFLAKFRERQKNRKINIKINKNMTKRDKIRHLFFTNKTNNKFKMIQNKKM